MKIPGLDEITSNLRDLPQKTDEMQATLGRIEALLEELVEIQRGAHVKSTPPGYA